MGINWCLQMSVNKRIRAKLLTDHARISVTLSRFTLPLLARIYRAFDGDMVLAMVLGELAHRNVLDCLAKEAKPEAQLRGKARHKPAMRPCSSLSIADACDLPRETVRRKVVALIERGYVYRGDEGYLHLTSGAGRDFEDMTGEIIEGLLATAWQLEALIGVRRPPQMQNSLKRRMATRSPVAAAKPAPKPSSVKR